VVLPLDFFGSGAFHDRASPKKVQALVQHCRKQLTDRGVKPPFCVLALSMGAMVSTAWVRVRPDSG